MRAGKTRSFFEHLWSGRADPDVSHIHNRMPVTAELSNLLGVNFQQQVGAMRMPVRCGMDVGHLEAAPRDGGQDPHQGTLRVAIVDVICMHVTFSKNYVTERGSIF